MPMDAGGRNPFLAPDGRARSLNRAHIVRLPPGLSDHALQGLDGYGLISAQSLRGLIGEAGLDDATAGSDPFLVLDAAFDNPALAERAAAVARAYGRRLGCLLAALKLGHPANRAARPDWNDAHWAYWASVQRVVVGGGLVSGRLGEIAVDTAAETVRAAGAPDLAVRRSPFGRWLPLLGLAASVPCEAGQALVFDFGQTAVKRGLATLAEGLVTALDLLPALPSPCHGLSDDAGPTGAAARWAAMRDQIAATWRETGAGGAPSIGICVASHMQAGHPLPTDKGCYGSLQQLAPHLETFMSDDLSAVLGRPLPVTLMHDGTAAAAACAGSDRTAVLVLGTAIGVGYTDGLLTARRLSGSLAVQVQPAGRTTVLSP